MLLDRSEKSVRATLWGDYVSNSMKSGLHPDM